MRNYRAVIIDGRKLIKKGAVLLVSFLLAVAMITNIDRSGSNRDERLKNIIDESIPLMSAVSGEDGSSWRSINWGRKLLSAILTFDIYDKTTIINDAIPQLKVISNSILALKARGEAVEAYNPQNADKGEGSPNPDMPTEGQYPIKAVDSSQAKSLGGSKKILIRNETEYGIDIEKMLDDKLSFDMKGAGPHVLILHTHATECYTEEGMMAYSPDKSDRCMETDKNVVKVGEKIKQVLEKNGIKAIHDTTLHDHPNFNGSYANSLKTVEMYKAKYPSIKVVLDIHRDAYVYDDGSKAKFVSEIDGKNVAQMMFVVGTNAGGLEHPNWRENMKLALKLQQHISKEYPSLMRGVNLRKERFNGHTTMGSLIIEVGSSGNTMNEALAGAEYMAEKMAQFFKKLK